MVNSMNLYLSILHNVMKLAGMKPLEVEIEQGTVLHFWAPSKKEDTKPNVVLIHGFETDGIFTWQSQSLALRKKYNLYVPDLLFFGKSYTKTSQRSTRFQADCIAKGLKSMLGDEKCTVVGFSYGGFVGFKMAEFYPELVESMVISGSYLTLSESISNKALERIGFNCWPDVMLPETVEGLKALNDVCASNFPWMPDFFHRHNLEVMFSNRKDRVELLEALITKDEDVTIHEFQQEIHLLWGGEDKIFNLDVAYSLKERLGGKAMLKVVEKAGHICLLEKSAEFNKYLIEMLDSLASAKL